MRICHEGKAPPLLLDERSAGTLSALCAALGHEVMALPLWQREGLNAALGGFFNELVTLLHPVQAGRCIRDYLKVLKGEQRVEDFELRLVLLEHLAAFDHFVVMNNPPAHSGGVALGPRRARDIVAAAGPAPLEMRDGGALPSHWLSELVLHEAMQVVALPSTKLHVKEHGVRVLRQLFVKHAYDTRYQDELSRRRIACMYLPLLGLAMDRVEVLRIMPAYAEVRRDLLACVVYLLQDAPSAHQRELFRAMVALKPPEAPPAAAAAAAATPPARAAGGAVPPPKFLRARGGAGAPARAAPPAFRPKPPPFTHGRNPGTHPRPEVSRPQGVGALAVRMLHLLRLVLDTFEYPGDEGAGNNLVPGLVPPAEYREAEAPRAAGTAPKRLSSQVKGRDALKELDSLLKGRAGTKISKLGERLKAKTRLRTGKRSFVDKRATGERVRSVRRGGGGGRAREASPGASPMRLVSATKWQSHLAHAVAHRTFLCLVDEAAPGIAPSGRLEGSALAFMEEAQSYLLHALCVAQSDDMLVALFFECKKLAFRFGGPAFFKSAGNGVQEWCRRLLCHANAPVARVRHAAVSCLVYLLKTAHAWRGDLSPVALPLLAVAPQCLREMGGPCVGGGVLHDAGVHPVKERSEVPRAFEALRVSLKELRSWRAAHPDVDGSGVSPAVADGLDLVARQIGVLVDAFIVDAVLLDDMESAAREAGPAAPGGGPMAYVTGPVAAAGGVLSKEGAGADVNLVQRALLRAADLYSPSESPQLRVYYLGRLEALHEALGNKAEGALAALAAADTIGACRADLAAGRLWAPHPFDHRPDGRFAVHTGGRVGARDRARRDAADAGGALVRSARRAPWQSLDKADGDFFALVERAAGALASIPLPLHVLEAYERLRPRLAARRDLLKLRQVHARIAEAFQAAADEEAVWRAGEFAQYGFPEGGGMRSLGAYFRVLVFGVVPTTLLADPELGAGGLELRAHAEFVYRYQPMVQLVTAKRAVTDMLRHEFAKLGRDAQEIRILPDRADEEALLREEGAESTLVKITLVRPVPPEVAEAAAAAGEAEPAVRRGHSFEGVAAEASGGGERYSHFEFSVPFTASGKMQGSTAEQCKKRTYLSVGGAFPALLTRAPVTRRRTVLLSPIDCALDDLRQRCVQMQMELAKPPEKIDKHEMMRLVGGSVIPQVNGGALEIAECFLGSGAPAKLPLVEDPERVRALQAALASELLVFLNLCRELTVRTRHVLQLDQALIQSQAETEDSDSAPRDNTDLTWQIEVERGLENMKAAMQELIEPIKVPGAAQLFHEQSSKFYL